MGTYDSRWATQKGADQNRRLVAMNDLLGLEPQLQGIKDAMQVPLARGDHPMAQSTTADRYPCALEGLRQTIERRAIHVFVDKGEGERRSRGNAARQGLCGHRRNDDRRGDPGAVTIAACIFGAGILKDRCLHLDVKLLGYGQPWRRRQSYTNKQPGPLGGGRSEEQIIGVLKEQEAGAKAADLARRHGVSEATIYNWKAKYGGLEVSEAKRLRTLEDENAKLKRLLAEAMLDNAGLKDLLAKNW
jgi:putative transposase